MTQQHADLFTAIDHVGVAVSDLDAAIAFYRDTYGMTLQHEGVNEEQGVRGAMMGVGTSGSCVQLLAPLSPESSIAKFLDRSVPGLQQVAYRVTDVDAVSATLRERGLRLLFDTPRRGTADSRVGSTSSTPRTPAGSWSSSSSPPDSGTVRTRVAIAWCAIPRDSLPCHG